MLAWRAEILPTDPCAIGVPADPPCRGHHRVADSGCRSGEPGRLAFDDADRRERRTFRGMDSPSRAAFWLRIMARACLAAAVLVLAVTGWIVWGD